RRDFVRRSAGGLPPLRLPPKTGWLGYHGVPKLLWRARGSAGIFGPWQSRRGPSKKCFGRFGIRLRSTRLIGHGHAAIAVAGRAMAAPQCPVLAATLKRYKAAERAQRRAWKLKRKRASKRKSERYLKVTYKVLDLLALPPPAAKISSNHHLDVEITTMSNNAQ